MRRTRFTIVTLSMAASAMVLGMPAATAASMSEAGNGQVQVVTNHHDDGGDGGFGNGGFHRRHEHRRHHVRRHHHLRWHHRCGPGWDSGWVRGSDRDRFRDRDRDDRRNGDRDFRDRDFRDNGDRGWGRGWLSKCDWHRGHHTAPKGAVKAGEGGSVTNLSTPELAAGGSLAAIGIAGAVGAMRRRSSSR